MTDLALRSTSTAVYRQSFERARSYAQEATSSNTRKAYAADWRHFTAWCSDQGLATLPASAETVAVYISDMAETLKTSTISRHVTAIAQAHRTAGLTSPTTDASVQQVLKGVRRHHGTRQQGKEAAVTADVKAMVATLADTLTGLRDRAMLLLGFSGAFRRSELVGLDVNDLEFSRDGLVVNIRKSKTDQEGAGRQVGIPYGASPTTCPVQALEAWTKAAGLRTGPLFHSVDRHGNVRPERLSDQSVALVVKRAAGAAGLNASLYAGHSLRAGLATSAAAAGVSERTIMAQTGHKSLPVVRRYIRRGTLFADNAASKVGL